jgi:acetylornithine/succinyldiaminopimelate/putrescine aminotransferase
VRLPRKRGRRKGKKEREVRKGEKTNEKNREHLTCIHEQSNFFLFEGVRGEGFFVGSNLHRHYGNTFLMAMGSENQKLDEWIKL